MLWMLAAILICGASVFTACSSNDDNPFQPVVQVGIDKTNFPDDNFWNYLLEQDYGKDGVLTDEEIRNITVMDVSEKEIKSLKGIEYFTALRTLNCSDNELTELDISGNTALDTLDCRYNELTALDVSKNTALRSLDCSINELTELDLSKNTALTHLSCDDNKLTALDISKKTELTYLSCDFNELTALDVSKNTALTVLSCSGNSLTSLDISKNTALELLRCSGNALTALDVSANTSLVYMACDSNQLATLDLSKNMALNKLLCCNNQISGQNMDALIGSLRQNESEEFCEFYVMDGNEPNQNVCTKSQAAAAKAKGWLPQYWDEDEKAWLEYEGSDE